MLYGIIMISQPGMQAYKALFNWIPMLPSGNF